jgi:HTH-like domain
VEREQPDLSLKRQAGLLSLSRASLYYQPLPPSAEEIAIKHRIDELYTAHSFYGSRKITALLQSDWSINRKRVQRYMREMGLAGICPKPNLSQPAPGYQIYPYLLRHVTASYPNHVWGLDGRPFGRLVNISKDMNHHQGWFSSPWRLWRPSSPKLVSFQGTSASREAETDRQKANVQERMGWG